MNLTSYLLLILASADTVNGGLFNGLHTRGIRAAHPARKLDTGDPPLTNVGDAGMPASTYPLRKCEGDCDDDDDCEV